MTTYTNTQAQETVRSKDGTSIPFDRSGEGPAVVLVAAALADRSDTAQLAKHLAEHFLGLWC